MSTIPRLELHDIASKRPLHENFVPRLLRRRRLAGSGALARPAGIEPLVIRLKPASANGSGNVTRCIKSSALFARQFQVTLEPRNVVFESMVLEHARHGTREERT